MTDEQLDDVDVEVDPRATTTNGWPFPVASDPVAGGAAAIQALANKLDTGPVATSGDIVAHAGASELRLGVQPNPVISFGPVANGDYLYKQVTGQLATGGRLTVGGKDVLRMPYNRLEHLQEIIGPSSAATSYSVAYPTAFLAAPLLCGDHDNPFSTPPGTQGPTSFTVSNPTASGVQGRWLAVGQG